MEKLRRNQAHRSGAGLEYHLNYKKPTCPDQAAACSATSSRIAYLDSLEAKAPRLPCLIADFAPCRNN